MFDEKGDRKGLTQIEQLQGKEEVTIGVFDPSLELENRIIWHPNNTVFWPSK